MQIMPGQARALQVFCSKEGTSRYNLDRVQVTDTWAEATTGKVLLRVYKQQGEEEPEIDSPEWSRLIPRHTWALIRDQHPVVVPDGEHAAIHTKDGSTLTVHQNGGSYPPTNEFLSRVRRDTTKEGSLSFPPEQLEPFILAAKRLRGWIRISLPKEQGNFSRIEIVGDGGLLAEGAVHLDTARVQAAS